MTNLPKRTNDDSLSPAELRKQRLTIALCIVLIIVAAILIVNEIVKR